MLAVLDCADSPEALGRAIAVRTAAELEELGEKRHRVRRGPPVWLPRPEPVDTAVLMATLRR